PLLHFLPFPSTSQPPPLPHTLSLPDALPIYARYGPASLARMLKITPSGRCLTLPPALRHPFSLLVAVSGCALANFLCAGPARALDRKSTRLNSSHVSISYAVFRLKKKKKPP